MLNSLIIVREKGKKLPEEKFKKSGWISFRYFHKLSKYPKSSKIEGGDAI